MKSSDKVKQMISAIGWYALYGKEVNGVEVIEWVSALCAFAVIEDSEGDERIIGLDGENRDYIDEAESVGNFLRHIYSPSERPKATETTEAA